jgi:uncharacterized membrane protein
MVDLTQKCNAKMPTDVGWIGALIVIYFALTFATISISQDFQGVSAHAKT